MLGCNLITSIKMREFWICNRNKIIQQLKGRFRQSKGCGPEKIFLASISNLFYLPAAPYICLNLMCKAIYIKLTSHTISLNLSVFVHFLLLVKFGSEFCNCLMFGHQPFPKYGNSDWSRECNYECDEQPSKLFFINFEIFMLLLKMMWCM